MAAFLRKKSKNDPQKPQPQAQHSPQTPLFSRFSTSHNPANNDRVVVSGPMSLAPGRRDSALVHSSRNTPAAGDVQQQRRRTTNPQPPPPSAFNYYARGAEFSGQNGYHPQPPYPGPPGPQPGQKYGRYSLPAQQAFTPTNGRDKPLPPGDHPHNPQYGYERTPIPMRAPQPIHPPNTKPLPTPLGDSLPPQNTQAYQSPPSNRASYQPIAGTNLQPQQNLGFDTQTQQGRYSPLIDLPPEIALFQVSLVSLV